MLHSNNVWNFHCTLFFHLFPLFSVGEGKKEEAQMVKLQASEPTHIHTQGRNMNKARGWVVGGNKAERVISCRQIT